MNNLRAQEPNDNLNIIKKESTLSENLESFLQKEKLWQKWKENNCSNFEKPISKEIQDALNSWEDFKKSAKFLKLEKFTLKQNQEKKKFFKGKENGKTTSSNEFTSKITEKTVKIIEENIGALKKAGMFDLNTELFKYLDLTQIEVK